MFWYGKEGGVYVNFPPQARLSPCSFCALVVVAGFSVSRVRFGFWGLVLRSPFGAHRRADLSALG